MTKSISKPQPATDEEIKALIKVWQKKLDLQDWRIILSHRIPSHPKAALEVGITRDRNMAHIRVADKARNQSARIVERYIIHELLHLVMEDVVYEYESQKKPVGRKIEYSKKFMSEFERVVEGLAHILYRIDNKK